MPTGLSMSGRLEHENWRAAGPYLENWDRIQSPVSPDRRQHRGPHPQDRLLFSEEKHSLLRQATADLSWLLDRGYAPVSSLKLVGDRFRLTDRQRVAIRRAACSDGAADSRRSKEVDLDSLAGKLVIDGFNVIVTIEAALGGGVLLLCRDRTIRDLASVHGSYRKVEETVEAVRLIAEVLSESPVREVAWLLDRPVSNSGRLAALLRTISQDAGRPWTVQLVDDVDGDLLAARHPIATSDSRVLDGPVKWVNLARRVVERVEPKPRILDLGC